MLKSGGPLVALDSATGKTLVAYEGMVPQEVLLTEGKLVISDLRQRVDVRDPVSGKALWSFKGGEPGRLRAGDGRLYLQAGQPRRGGRGKRSVST